MARPQQSRPMTDAQMEAVTDPRIRLFAETIGNATTLATAPFVSSRKNKKND